MVSYRFLIVSLVFLFSLFGFVTAYASCLVETKARAAGQIPTSITCLDRGAHSFLSTFYHPGHKSSSSLKVGERAVDDYRVALLHEGHFYSTSLRRLAPALVSLSIPIYQLKAVYLI